MSSVRYSSACILWNMQTCSLLFLRYWKIIAIAVTHWQHFRLSQPPLCLYWHSLTRCNQNIFSHFGVHQHQHQMVVGLGFILMLAASAGRPDQGQARESWGRGVWNENKLQYGNVPSWLLAEKKEIIWMKLINLVPDSPSLCVSSPIMPSFHCHLNSDTAHSGNVPPHCTIMFPRLSAFNRRREQTTIMCFWCEMFHLYFHPNCNVVVSNTSSVLFTDCLQWGENYQAQLFPPTLLTCLPITSEILSQKSK